MGLGRDLRPTLSLRSASIVRSLGDSVLHVHFVIFFHAS